MRAIQFPTGTHRTTQTGVAAVLRALVRRGTRTWYSSNVVRELTEYINEHLDGFTVDINRVGYALKWLDDNGYARRRLSETGKRTIGFALADDVEFKAITLQRDELPPQPRPTRPRRTSLESNDWGRYASALSSSPPLPLSPPTPALPPTDGLYRLDELNTALQTWSVHDREAYTAWVDVVLRQLQDVVDTDYTSEENDYG